MGTLPPAVTRHLAAIPHLAATPLLGVTHLAPTPPNPGHTHHPGATLLSRTLPRGTLLQAIPRSRTATPLLLMVSSYGGTVTGFEVYCPVCTVQHMTMCCSVLCCGPPLPCSVAQYYTARYRTVPYCTVLFCTVLCGTARKPGTSSLRAAAAPCPSFCLWAEVMLVLCWLPTLVQYSTILYCTVLYCTVLHCSLVPQASCCAGWRPYCPS